MKLNILKLVISLTSTLMLSISALAESIDREIERNLGLEYANVSKGVIKVTIKPEGRCFFGDLDAMILELGTSAKDTKYYLSLESMDNTSSQSTNFTELPSLMKLASEPNTFELAIPNKDSKLLGLYLCKSSSSNFTTCKDKKVVSYNEILKRYQVNYNKKDKTVQNVSNSPEYLTNSADKIYFYKPIIVQDYKVAVPTKAMSNSRYESMNSMLSKLDVNNKSLESDMKTMLQLSSTLESIPLQVKKGEVVITLPGFSAKKCGL